MTSMMPQSNQPMQQSGFDYSQLDDQTAKLAWQRAQEIRWLKESIEQTIVEIGKKLIEVKASMPHGTWATWLHKEFQWSKGHAQSLIRIGHAFGDLNLKGVTTMSTALQLVTRSNLPQEIVDEARQHLQEGSLTVNQARDIVRQIDPQLAESFNNFTYWNNRRKQEAQQVISYAAEFQAATRNLQIELSEIYDPVHPRVKRAIDQLIRLISVIMDTEKPRERAKPSRKGRDTSSKYWGVSRPAGRRHWQVSIRNGEKSIYLGHFEDEEEAARAYDAKARELYGDQARLNFPDD